LREPWDPNNKQTTTLKGFAFKTNPFRVKANVYWLTQGSSLREPWDPNNKQTTTLKGFAFKTNPFRVKANVYWLTQGSRKLEPWAEISECLRRYFNGHSRSFL